MTRKIIFTILFLFSLSGLQIASFSDWLILSLLIQTIWIAITSNEILELNEPKNSTINKFQKFNKILVYLLIADIIILFLSMSFGFRIVFAPLYKPIFFISIVCILISLFGNYYVIINWLKKRTKSLGKRGLFILSSLFYPIGIFMITPE
ncbi:hypothetical protein JBL43_19000 [Aureibaculum sp. A20]|uniref:Uncharacterized protein n=1 Tax=Aureibaculum flavum TaxID=2795986 RepID=A0ABS0WWM2_9FLAO|nr:hypothetical protein [Aureibaculum flavum]MBJ2176348.1 hypothetical protein [Aureibaculum flavum]